MRPRRPRGGGALAVLPATRTGASPSRRGANGVCYTAAMPASALATSEPASSSSTSGVPARETVAARVHPAVLRPTFLAIALGGAQGALLYGGIIAVLHARHNTIGVWDALVLLGW